jgi:alkylhydroperoxidase family enzyme
MARLNYLDAGDLAEADRDLLARPIALHRLLVHSPGAARAFGGLGSYIRHGSTLDPRLRELAILQVGWLARSPYEWSHHVKIGQDFGVSEADIEALIADSAGQPNPLDAQARAVLRAAREMTGGLAASDASFAALRGFLGASDLTDLVLTIAFYNAVVRFLATMQIDVEPEYQPYLDRFPLPQEG